MNMSRNDRRAAVLNCATSLEVMLKKKLVEYFESNPINQDLQEYLLKQADGFSKLLELSKKLKIPLEGMPNVQETVMRIRHRVIHGGCVPTYTEAHTAFDDTRRALRALTVQMFE